MIRSLLFLAVLLTTQVATAADSNKLVLTYQGRETVQGRDVDIFTIGKNRDILFGLVPLDQQPSLSPGDIQICQRVSQLVGVRTFEGKEYGDFHVIAFLCGRRRYIFTYLDVR